MQTGKSVRQMPVEMGEVWKGCDQDMRTRWRFGSVLHRYLREKKPRCKELSRAAYPGPNPHPDVIIHHDAPYTEEMILKCAPRYLTTRSADLGLMMPEVAVACDRGCAYEETREMLTNSHARQQAMLVYYHWIRSVMWHFGWPWIGVGMGMRKDPDLLGRVHYRTATSIPANSTLTHLLQSAQWPRVDGKILTRQSFFPNIRRCDVRGKSAEKLVAVFLLRPQ